jgi:putative PIN family toxin of toxin-antitoxin system
MKVDKLGAYARVVVDTNVLLSAALSPKGIPAVVVEWILREGALLFSNESFAELETRIWKAKFDRYLSIVRRKQLLHDFNASALWVSIPDALNAQNFSRDKHDDAFIRTALAANATRLISGDEDLLILHPLDQLHIVSPRSAWDEIHT